MALKHRMLITRVVYITIGLALFAALMWFGRHVEIGDL